MKKPITRRQMIAACIQSYMRNNPAEWVQFENYMKEKRSKLTDPKYAMITEDVQKFQKYGGDTMRSLWDMPKKLWDAIATMMDAHQQPRFGDDSEEVIWFQKNYPKFYVGQKTNVSKDDLKT